MGTLFEQARTPLQIRFDAMHLLTTTRHGGSAKELQRQPGVTTYQPMKHLEVNERQTLDFAGIGGLDHMAVQICKALGVTVVALTTTSGKVDAVLALGADKVVLMDDKEPVEAAGQTGAWLGFTDGATKDFRSFGCQSIARVSKIPKRPSRGMRRNHAKQRFIVRCSNNPSAQAFDRKRPVQALETL